MDTLYTFGVEIEFIIRFKIDDYLTATWTQSVPYLHRLNPYRPVHRSIVNYLRSQGYTVNDYCSHYIDTSCWTIKPAPTVEACKDSTAGDEWGFSPVKLLTPVMVNKPPFFDEIDGVLSCLKEKFHISINDSCSLNVYVGNLAAYSGATARRQHSQSLGFLKNDAPSRRQQSQSLGFLKNFLCIVWVYQNQLNQIHLPGRLDQPCCLSPVTMLSYLNPRIVKEGIQSCTSIEALWQLWEGQRRFDVHTPSARPAYSIEHMLAHIKSSGDRFDSGNRTVRFGQHRSTLESLEIYHWVMLVGHMVSLADQRKPWGWPLAVALREETKLPVEVSEVSIVQLLDWISAEEQADYYAERERLYKHSSCNRRYTTDSQTIASENRIRQ